MDISNSRLLAEMETGCYDMGENRQGGLIMATSVILKTLREKHNLTQEELAERVLVTRHSADRILQ